MPKNKDDNLQNVSYETLDTAPENPAPDFKESQGYKDFVKELKEIKETLKSFEISEDEQESIIKDEILKDETKEKPKMGLFFAILGVIAVLCVIFWDKIKAKFDKNAETNAI